MFTTNSKSAGETILKIVQRLAKYGKEYCGTFLMYSGHGFELSWATLYMCGICLWWRVKAMQFDIEQVYKSRLQVSLHRLQLRTELYTKPDRSEDTAASIIEQVIWNCGYTWIEK